MPFDHTYATMLRSLFLASTLSLLTTACAGETARSAHCGTPGQWLAPTAGAAQPREAAAVFADLAGHQVVLLGERHDSAEDHRWQLHTLSRLHALRPGMAIGFEMFPRRVQPALDAWVAGTLAEAEFLQRSEWDKVWGFDVRDYLPLFHFARMNRLPMLALNVERSLPEAIGKRGWDAIPEAQREGVGRPAAPAAAYRKELRRVFDHHPAKERGSDAFPRFVEAQTVWDRAMAEVIAAHLARQPDALVVGIVGAGHVRSGHGIAHQLADLGIGNTGALLTWERTEDCARLGTEFADALYVIDPPPRNPPRLGVATEPVADGLRISQVTPDSIAAAAGLVAGDVILTIGGQPAQGPLALRAAVQRQPAGTWLPMTVRRDGAEIEIVARFPLGQ